MKVLNIRINEKTEFTEIQNKSFLFSNGDSYHIEKALQTIQFELDKTGGKIKSEAGMMVNYESVIMVDEIGVVVMPEILDKDIEILKLNIDIRVSNIRNWN